MTVATLVRRAACFVYPIVTATLLAGAAQAFSQPAVEQASAKEREREKISAETRFNMKRLKACVAASRACAANDFPRLLLRLTRPEVEEILGPPQYRLRLTADDLYYWTVPLKGNVTLGAVRLRVIFGDCYDREETSRKKAVCEAAIH